jgi:hypothetical protein
MDPYLTVVLRYRELNIMNRVLTKDFNGESLSKFFASCLFWCFSPCILYAEFSNEYVRRALWPGHPAHNTPSVYSHLSRKENLMRSGNAC